MAGRRSRPPEDLESSVSGPGAANVKVPMQRGAGLVSGTEGLCSQHTVARGEIREKPGAEAEPRPGQGGRVRSCVLEYQTLILF